MALGTESNAISEDPHHYDHTQGRYPGDHYGVNNGHYRPLLPEPSVRATSTVTLMTITCSYSLLNILLRELLERSHAMGLAEVPVTSNVRRWHPEGTGTS